MEQDQTKKEDQAVASTAGLGQSMKQLSWIERRVVQTLRKHKAYEAGKDVVGSLRNFKLREAFGYAVLGVITSAAKAEYKDLKNDVVGSIRKDHLTNAFGYAALGVLSYAANTSYNTLKQDVLDEAAVNQQNAVSNLARASLCAAWNCAMFGAGYLPRYLAGHIPVVGDIISPIIRTSLRMSYKPQEQTSDISYKTVQAPA